MPRSLRAPAKSSKSKNHTKIAPTTPPGINPFCQILRMESDDRGAAGAVAVAMWAKKKQVKRAPGGHETFRVSNNFGPAGRRNPSRAVKLDGGVRESELAGRTPSPPKKVQGKEAPFLFRPDPFAAAKGERDAEATKSVAEDDLDDIEAEVVAEDNSDDDKGASSGWYHCKTRAAKVVRGSMGANGRPKARQDPYNPADRAGDGPQPAKAPPKSGRIAEDDSDDDKGASVGHPYRKTRAANGSHGIMGTTGRPKAGQDPYDLANQTGDGPQPAKALPKSGRVAKDDADNSKGASVGRPCRKARVAKHGRGTVGGTRRPKGGQDPQDPADRAGNGFRPAKVPPKIGRGVLA